MSITLREKYDLIYVHEETFSYRLAQQVLKKPDVSAWMILLPVLFVHHMFKVSQYRAGVRSFAQNIMNPRIKALNKAYNEAETGKRTTYRLEDYYPGLELSGKDKPLAEKQVQVILVMEEHFLALLQQSGQSLEELLRGAYPGAGEYRRHLNRLAASERELNRYLTQNVHTSEESKIVVRQMEQECARLREEELRLFF